MNSEIPEEWRTEVEFVKFVESVLAACFPNAVVMREPRLADRAVPDLVMVTGDDVFIIEAKRETPFTGLRLEEARDQVASYREAAIQRYGGKAVRAVLLIPGVLSADKVEVLASAGIDVWDKNWLKATLDAGPTLEVGGGPRPENSAPESPSARQCRELQETLASIEPGRTEWSRYQKVSMEIWETLFYPELSRPIRESENESGANRRDFVVPNYAADGFWAFMRSHYNADYVVVDAKNLSGLVTKSNVLQICNYMSRHGTGLFGAIMTRNGIDTAALYTRREHWVLYSKMLIVLTDEDVVQMLDNVINGDDPSLVIRQKIEDFRLSL